jgi:glycosyltransferase involved in cell wall biosynthesis
MKVGLLTTHPIQYQIPWFRALHETPGIDLTVFYCLLPDAEQQGEGFGVPFTWDIPLLDGYRHQLLENVASHPSVGSFGGCDTPGIVRLVRDGGFDAFIVNGWVVKSCLQLLYACRRYGVPCIVRGESNSLRPRPFFKRAIHRLLLAQYSAFLYIGEGNRRFYRNGGVRDDQLFFAPYCIDGSRFSAAAAQLAPERGAFREKWGVPADALTFLFSGKFIAKKRPMDLLIALNELGAEARAGNIHLMMVGTGELLDACKAFARDHDLPVSFTGFLNQSEIPAAYVCADVLLLPSDNGETWGLVVNEGMACGLPAIVSDQVGCHLDLITPGETGFVYETGNVRALADCMRRLSHSPDDVARLSRNARARVERYNYQAVLKGTLDALRAVGRNAR